jgi:hypothetical protein
MDKFEDYVVLEKNLVEAIDLQGEDTTNELKLEWNNKVAISRANQIFKVLGEPNTVDKKKGGLIIWRNVDPFFRQSNMYPENIKSQNVYSKLVIKDEEIPHLIPVPHTDWFYAYMYLDIPSHIVDNVLALTESVGYDTMSKEVYARCHFMPANLTSLYLIKQIVNGHKNLTHAQQEYVVLIPTLAKEEKEGKGLLEKENVGNWHKTLTQYLFSLK